MARTRTAASAILGEAQSRKTLIDGENDIILMDVLMPELDGLEATRIIHLRMKEPPKTIAMTASVPDGDREMCFKAGMDGFVRKPTKMDELKSALLSCCQACHEYSAAKSPEH